MGGSRRVAAPACRRRPACGSRARQVFSTSTRRSRRGLAAVGWARSVMLTVTPNCPGCRRPGWRTTGRPISRATAQASSSAWNRATDRHRHAGGVQQLLGQVLVLRDDSSDTALGADLGGLDAALARASRAGPGCPASGAGSGCQGASAALTIEPALRPQAHVLVELAQLGDRRGDIELAAGRRGTSASAWRSASRPTSSSVYSTTTW